MPRSDLNWKILSTRASTGGRVNLEIETPSGRQVESIEVKKIPLAKGYPLVVILQPSLVISVRGS